MKSNIRNADGSYTDIALEIKAEVAEMISQIMEDYSDYLHPDDITHIIFAEAFCQATFITALKSQPQ